MLRTIFSFVVKHVFHVFLKAVRNHLIGGVAKKVSKKIRKFFTGPNHEYTCVDCHTLYSYEELYEGYWFRNRQCPSCKAVNALVRLDQAQGGLRPPDRVYVIPAVT